MASGLTSRASEPTHLYYLISLACNERCTKCHHWAVRPPPKPIDAGLIADAVNSMPWLEEFCIVGGEPLLFRERIIHILKSIADHPCRTVLITNGVLLDSAFVALVAQLNIHIVVSIDTVDREHWQFVRGRDTWEQVMNNLRQARKQLRADQLSVQSVLAQETKDHLAGVRLLCEELGIHHSIQDYMTEGFNGEWTAMPSAEKKIPDHEPCHAAGRNLSIMPNGDVFTCFQQSWIPNCQSPLGNLRAVPMPQMLSSDYMDSVQAAMSRCNQPCKVLKCNQKNNDHHAAK